MDITHDNVCSSMLSCFYSHLLSTGRPISSLPLKMIKMSSFLKSIGFFLSSIGGLHLNYSLANTSCHESVNVPFSCMKYLFRQSV